MQGNEGKIQDDKKELMTCFEGLIEEIKDLNFNEFKNYLNKGIEDQGELEKLREKDKDLQKEIKDITTKQANAQDEFAQ